MKRKLFLSKCFYSTAISALILALFSLGRADTAKEYYKATLSTATANLGSSLVYTVEVMTSGEASYSPDITVPDLSAYFQVGETFSRSSVNILNGQTYIINLKEVQLIANHKGALLLPPAKVELIDAKTKQRQYRQTNPVAIQVNEASGAAALPTPTPEIDVLRPIKASAQLSLGQWLPFAIGGGLIAAMLSIMLYLRHRPEPQPAAAAEPVDPRSPVERALEALEKAMRLKNSGKVNEFYTALSSALRRYMAESFHFKAEEATTREMLQEMERLNFKPDFLEKYRAYFLECDQVKFANASPDPDKVEAALPRTKELIQTPLPSQMLQPEPEIPPAGTPHPSEKT